MKIETYKVNPKAYPKEWYAEFFRIGVKGTGIGYICLGHRMVRITYGRRRR